MRNFSTLINIALLSVIILFGSSLSQAKADVTVVNDSPSFETVYQSIWGPDASADIKEFNVTIIDIDETGHDSKLWGSTIDTALAIPGDQGQFLCPEGSFIDPFTGGCYSCPDGFSHNPLKMVDENGVCFKRHSLTTADPVGDIQFICPDGQFPDALFQNCYSCPSGYDHNSLLQVDENGVCFSVDTTSIQQQGSWGCSSGEFPDIGLNSCYSCPSGYIHNPALTPTQSGACYKWVPIETITADKCGYKSWGKHCSYKSCWWVLEDWEWVKKCKTVYYSCWKTFGCQDGYLYGDNLYKCPSGYNYGGADKCWKPGYTSNKTATNNHSYSCSSGTSYPDGNCYSCPGGYVEVLGACIKNDYTVADYQGETVLFCDDGEFLSEGACYTCPSGMEHEFLLPASVEGVCYKQDEYTAESAGDLVLGCQSGSFLNVADNKCYSCPPDYSWNPLIPIGEYGSCYAWSLDESLVGSGLDVGYEFNSIFRYKFGLNGGITVDGGSVDVAYSPEINVTISEGQDTPQGWQTFVVSTSQSEDSTLDMETRWAGIDMFLDSWTDSEFKVDTSFIYPKHDPVNGVWSQAQDDHTLWDNSTDGPTTLADDPLVAFHIGYDSIGLSVLGKGGGFTGFDPPIEIMRPVFKTPTLKLGVVFVEAGLQGPSMSTPVENRTGSWEGNGSGAWGMDRPYQGDYSEKVIIKPGGDGTYIKQNLDAGERTGFKLLSLNAGLKDPDVARVDFDLDGILSYFTDEPLGFKLEEPIIGSPVGSWWSVAADLADFDLGLVLSFQSDYKFEPNLQVELTFSSPVRVVTDSVVSSAASTHVVSLGEELRFVHPGGELTIDTTYSVKDNTFTNDTDLNLTTLFEGEVLSFRVTMLGVSKSKLPKFSMLNYTVELNPEPWRLADLNYHEDSKTDDLFDDEASAFTLSGFSDVTGSQLVVTGMDQVVAVCKDITVTLDDNGLYYLTPEEIDNDSQDPGSSGPPLFTLSQYEFDCSDIGNNSVTLEVTGSTGTFDSCDAIVTVVDTTEPVAVAQSITAELDATGTVSITAAQVNNGSSDNCSIESMTVSPGAFTCSNIGGNNVVLTVTDSSGNSASVTAIVTVVDSVLPTVIVRDTTVQLDASGNASITAGDVDNGSSDNCGNVTLDVAPSAFTCVNVGDNKVTLTVTDDNGNTNTALAIVTVEDNTAPTALARDITVQLNASGNVSILASEVDNDSSDNCGVTSLSVVPDSFTCSNVGSNNVMLTVTDASGNFASATATVTVVDSVLPTVIVRAITVQLDASGNASITAAAVDNGSSDACGIASLTISKETFDCSNVGPNTVTLTVTDNNNNIITKDATVTVEDNIIPVAITRDITVHLDETGHVTVEADDIDDGSNDACGIASLSVPPTSFGCSDIGEHTVTLTVEDNNGNSSTEDAVVTVVDSICPTVVVELKPVEGTLKKKKGCFEISVTAEDNCSVADVVADLNGYLVTDGMIVELKKKKKYKVKVKNEGSSDDHSSGHRRCNADVKFEGPDFILTATVTDSSDNGGGMGSCLDGDGIPTDTASVKHVFINDDHSSDDNGIHRGNDKKNNHKDKGKHKSEGKEKKKKGKK